MKKFLIVFPYYQLENNSGYEILTIDNISKIYIVKPHEICNICILYYEENLKKFIQIYEHYESILETRNRFWEIASYLSIYHDEDIKENEND